MSQHAPVKPDLRDLRSPDAQYKNHAPKVVVDRLPFYQEVFFVHSDFPKM